jgi:hypothetical protein
VKDNRIVSKIGEGWPVVSAGGNNKLTLTYWDGEEIKTLNQDQGMVLDIRGRVNVALRGMKEPPSHAAVGKSLTHLFGVAGNFRLTSGPKGATLSTTGQLKWTPTADQIGVQQFSYTVIVGGQSIARVSSIEVVSAEVAKQVGGDAGKLSQLMSLELGEGTATYTRGLDGKSALVLREGQLLVLNADGTTVDKGFDLPQTFTRIREREEYYIAVTQEPSAMLILDKETLKPIRTIKLLYKATTDLALHPNLPFTYIATDQPVEGEARYRVVVVDETNGEIREPENVVGTFLAVSPDGRHLYTGYKDLYRRGTRLFMNPDGRIWDSPQYGNIDILMIYDIDRGTKLALRKYKDNAGANGAGLAVSPDGKRLSYLSFSGYPAGSGAIPAWNPTDLEKKPVGYPCKGRTSATKMTYHPVLPMVLVPTETGCILFNRETGDEEKDRVKLPESVDGAKVEDAQFSPDGLSVVLQVRHAGTAYLKKLPLRLNSEEIKSISRGVPAMAPVPPKPEPSRSTTNEPRA